MTTATGVTSYIYINRFNGPTSSSTNSYRNTGVFTGGFQVTSSINTYVVSLSSITGTIDVLETNFSYTRIG